MARRYQPQKPKPPIELGSLVISKRLLLTGHGGFVAGSIANQAGDQWEVHAIARSKPPEARDGFQSYQFDLRDGDALRETFKTVNPDAVIHAAAIADIDYCQSHQDEAEATNVTVTKALAGLCVETGARMVFCSTDTVFRGDKGMYTESDEPAPVNFYGETKVRGEQHVLEALENGVVARLSLVMGLLMSAKGNSFLEKMIAGLSAGKQMSFPKNETRTPVDVITLGGALLELAGNGERGILHLAGSTVINRYAMAQRIAIQLGYDSELILATDSNAMPGRAPRPTDVSLDNAKARRTLATPMHTLESGLELVLNSKRKNDHE